MRFRPHFEPHVNTALKSHPSVLKLRTALRDHHRLNERSTERFLDSLLHEVLGDLADRYIGQMTTRLKKIQDLRSQLHGAIGDVVMGRKAAKEVTPEGLNAIFNDLQAELAKVKSPKDFADANPKSALELNLPPDAPDPTVKPKVKAKTTKKSTKAKAKPKKKSKAKPTPVEPAPGHGNWLDKLSKEDQMLFDQTRDMAGSELDALALMDSTEHRLALEGDLRSKLREEGMDPTKIDRAVELAHLAADARALHAKGLPPRVKYLVGWDPLLTKMAREHPDLLIELASDFRKRGGKYRASFSASVRRELKSRGLDIQPDVMPPRVKRPKAAAGAPEVLAPPGRKLDPGEFTRNPNTGEIVICNYAGPGHPRQGFEGDMPYAAEVGLAGWHRAHSQGAGTGKESAHGILYAPPEVNLEFQNLGIERFVREAVTQLDPGAKMILTTSTKAHPGTQRLASIEYKIEMEVDGVRTTVFEAGLEVQNVRDKPKVRSWANELSPLEQFLK